MSRRRKKLHGGLLSYPNLTKNDISRENYVKPSRWLDPFTGKMTEEWHLSMANYAGPGTNIVNRLEKGIKPTTITDAQAQRHDIDYHNIRALLRDKKIDRSKADKLVRSSDERLISVANKQRLSRDALERRMGRAVSAGIRGKVFLEKIGALEPKEFLGAGNCIQLLPENIKERIIKEEAEKAATKKKSKDPTRRLKKKFMKKLAST